MRISGFSMAPSSPSVAGRGQPITGAFVGLPAGIYRLRGMRSRRSAGQPGAEQVARELWVGRALRLPHHLPNQGIEGALLPIAELFHGGRVRRDHLVDHVVEGTRI